MTCSHCTALRAELERIRADIDRALQAATPEPRDVDTRLLALVVGSLRDDGPASGSELARRLRRRVGDVLAATRALHDRGTIDRDGASWTLVNASANGTASTRGATGERSLSRRNGD